MTCVAIDWSGAKTGSGSKIWLAEARGGRLFRLEGGRSRDEVVAEVIAMSGRDPDLIVGLDFAFSAPEWFLLSRGLSSVEDLWAAAGSQGEEWLAACTSPFWGRPGKKRPDLPEHFRRTEREAAGIGGSTPKSFFQIGGAGAVGTGSIRGLPFLGTLRAAGFSIWPFHDLAGPLVIEIYPRLLTGPVVKSSGEDRLRYLQMMFPELSQPMLHLAASGEDAFDAAVSAIVMSRNASALGGLQQTADPQLLREGAIWWPTDAAEVPAAASTAARDALDPGHAASRPAIVQEGCVFCAVPKRDVFMSSRHAIAIRDRYPVSRGHTLVFPRDHTRALFDLPSDVVADVWALVAEVRRALIDEVSPDGFNIGLNEGEAAGQTVSHAHIHVIPRFNRDVPDPRGGIRFVIADKAAYWDE